MNRKIEVKRGGGRSAAAVAAAGLACFFALAMVPASAADSGRLDRTFGDRGVVLFPDGSSSRESVMLPDGRSVSLLAPQGRLIRYLSDGSLDTSFGGGTGSVAAIGTTLARQSDGKLVVAATVTVGYPRNGIQVQRFYPDGSIDTAFGDNGKAIVEFDPVLSPSHILGYDVSAADVAVQADGSIVVAGTYYYYHYDGFSYYRIPLAQALVRFDAYGNLDEGFGDSGRRIQDTFTDADPETNPRESAEEIVLQNDGRLLVTGYLENPDSNIMVTRYNPDGSLDTLFGDNGVAIVPLDGEERGRDLQLQQDGRIVVAGYATNNGYPNADMVLVRLDTTGTLDSGFGSNGVTITDYAGGQDVAAAVEIQADGRLVIAGMVTDVVGQTMTTELIAVARYSADGHLETGFGKNGFATVEIDEILSNGASDLLIQPDGRLLATGSAMVRFLP